MGDFETVQAITDNIKTLCQGQGLKFSLKVIEDVENIPASLIPYGDIFYQGEEFEYDYGNKPGYIEAKFLLRVVLKEKAPADMIRNQQKWTHNLRGALTVDALNSGALAASKLVSKVEKEEPEIENMPSFVSVLLFALRVRYRQT